MSWIDGLLLGAVLAAALWRLLAPNLRPHWRLIALGLLAAFAVRLAGVDAFAAADFAGASGVSSRKWGRSGGGAGRQRVSSSIPQPRNNPAGTLNRITP